MKTSWPTFGGALVWAALCGALGSGSSAAAEPAISGYTDYAALSQQLAALGRNPLAAVRSLGTTLGRREVWLVSIGSGARDAKPAILIVGNVHAPQLLGSEVAVRMARRLVENGAADPTLRKILERVTVYVIPRPTPDASEAFFRRPLCERQGNERPVDHDRDGQPGEDGPDDLDHNGVITLMRVEDPSGDYRPSAADPRLLVKAERAKGQAGKYRLYTEGRDRDGDEQFAEDPAEGVVFNHNFPHKYPYYEPWAGPHAVSEVETRAVADFAFSRPNIVAVMSFTPEDNLVQPWKPDAVAEAQRVKTTVLAADAPYYAHLGEIYRKAAEIADAKALPAPPKGSGSFSEWVYFQYGRWSLAARGWSIPKVPAPGKGQTDSEELNALRWFAREKIAGFVDWKPIVHPDLPGKKVEVGGFKPFLRENPPAALLEPLAERHFTFLKRFVELLPRVSLAQPKIEPLGDGVYRVTATAINSGYLPSMSRMGQLSKEAYPLQIKIELPKNLQLVTGSPRTELPVLAGSGGQAEHRWLVRVADAGVPRATIRVWSPAVGEATMTIELKP